MMATIDWATAHAPPIIIVFCHLNENIHTSLRIYTISTVCILIKQFFRILIFHSLSLSFSVLSLPVVYDITEKKKKIVCAQTAEEIWKNKTILPVTATTHCAFMNIEIFLAEKDPRRRRKKMIPIMNRKVWLMDERRDDECVSHLNFISWSLC